MVLFFFFFLVRFIGCSYKHERDTIRINLSLIARDLIIETNDCHHGMINHGVEANEIILVKFYFKN